MAVLNLQKAIRSLEKTPLILKQVLKGVTQTMAERATDGPDGWNVLFILCHLRDCENLFFERVTMSVEMDSPRLNYISNDDLIRQNDYANQKLDDIVIQLHLLRQRTLEYIRPLNDEALARTGIHPHWGENSVLEYIINIALHDIDHIEQLIRALQDVERR